jgi:hypothetical protein
VSLVKASSITFKCRYKTSNNTIQCGARKGLFLEGSTEAEFVNFGLQHHVNGNTQAELQQADHKSHYFMTALTMLPASQSTAAQETAVLLQGSVKTFDKTPATTRCEEGFCRYRNRVQIARHTKYPEHDVAQQKPAVQQLQVDS